nr:flagellar filament capping protein FliD [uncultured Butyricicoccus sp.]
MSSVSSVGGSSSIYGQRNVLSGLASGMDTESMIENMTQATRLKIAQQKQKKQLLEWKQTAYQGISSQLIEFSKKYTSYSSSTNLLSSAFFDQSTITTTGKNSDFISATGKTSSDVVINGVKQLATSASWARKDVSDGLGIISSEGFSIAEDAQTEISRLNGATFTFTYSNKEYTISLGYDQDYKDPEKLVEALNEKLGETTIPGSDKNNNLGAKVEFSLQGDGRIALTTKENAGGNTIKLKSVSDNVKDVLGLGFDPGDDGIDLSKEGSLVVSNRPITEDVLKQAVSNRELLSGRTIQISLNGVSAKITLPTYKEGEDENWSEDELLKSINDQLDKTFGAGKVNVSNEATEDGQIKLQFNLGNGASNSNDVLRVSGGDFYALTVLGLESGQGNRINLDQSLAEYLGKTEDTLTEDDLKLTINGTDIQLEKDMTLREMMNAINSSDADVSMTYSELSDTIRLTSTQTGSGRDVDIQDSELARKLFGTGKGNEGNITIEKGQDAVLDVTVNGDSMTLTRSSNEVNIDGLKVTLKDEFGYDDKGVLVKGEEVSFTSAPKTDDMVTAIKEMVEDFNKMIQDVYKEMSTKPDSDYQPLTDEQKEEMSEDQIEKWEEKAKEGLLFGDSLLRSLQSSLRTVFSSGGETSKQLERMGITFEYSMSSGDGGKLSLDEDKLRAVIESDVESVKQVFTAVEGTDENGNRVKGGVMTEMKKILDQYASTSIATPGSLVARAGSSYSANSLLDNTLKNQMDSIDDILDTLNDKLQDQIDRYNSKFTQLEVLISQMNAQSGQLSGMLGG